MRTVAIIVAAGPGTRLGGHVPKAFVHLQAQPLFIHSVRALLRAPAICAAVIALPPGREREGSALLDAQAPWRCPVSVVTGGSERRHSVRAALDSIADADVIAVHDAARPFVTADAIERVVAAACRYMAATLAVPASDTLKQVDADGWIESTPTRERMWLAQTPQAFQADVLRRAHTHALAEAVNATDDAMLVERIGVRVKVVPGDPENRKITTPADLRWAEWMLSTSSAPR